MFIFSRCCQDVKTDLKPKLNEYDGKQIIFEKSNKIDDTVTVNDFGLKSVYKLIVEKFNYFLQKK